MNKLDEILKEYEAKKVFGEVLLKFEAGKVVFIKKTESIKP